MANSTTAPCSVPAELQANINRVAAILGEISCVAFNADVLCANLNENATEHAAIFLRQTINRIGWMADLGCNHTGGVGSEHDGRPEAWMLPPIYLDAQERAQRRWGGWTATSEGLLYEHEDGRRKLARSAADAAFTCGDPGWHRVGPVDLSELGRV